MLTNFVSLHVWNNKLTDCKEVQPVVNCWQILYLCTSETMLHNNQFGIGLLWIADKFCIFAYLKQLFQKPSNRTTRCELLTNFVSLHIWNNQFHNRHVHLGVVNCWQILYLCISETITLFMRISNTQLWIADKFCIFAYLKQWTERFYLVQVRCELLTNFVSLHIWNNSRTERTNSTRVVNCWQILYLCISETIQRGTAARIVELWIADKFCIFAYLKQSCR